MSNQNLRAICLDLTFFFTLFDSHNAFCHPLLQWHCLVYTLSLLQLSLSLSLSERLMTNTHNLWNPITFLSNTIQFYIIRYRPCNPAQEKNTKQKMIITVLEYYIPEYCRRAVARAVPPNPPVYVAVLIRPNTEFSLKKQLMDLQRKIAFEIISRTSKLFSFQLITRIPRIIKKGTLNPGTSWITIWSSQANKEPRNSLKKAEPQSIFCIKYYN